MSATLEDKVVGDDLADICIEERLVRVLAELAQFVKQLFSHFLRSSDMFRVRFALKHEALEDSK